MGIKTIGGAASSIQLPFIGTTKHPLYKKHRYHTGVDIVASDIHSFASGVVLSIGADSDNRYCVTVQYDVATCFRYMHLDSVNVSVGAVLRRGDIIGVADKYVHFEYITTSQDESIWPVHVYGSTYYKHNPELVLDGSVKLTANDWSMVTIASDGYEDVPLTDAMKLEFEGDNRGDY